MTPNNLELNDISGKIIEMAIKVHSELGPGMLEGAYEACLMFELMNAGLNMESQLKLPMSSYSVMGSEEC